MLLVTSYRYFEITFGHNFFSQVVPGVNMFQKISHTIILRVDLILIHDLTRSWNQFFFYCKVNLSHSLISFQRGGRLISFVIPRTWKATKNNIWNKIKRISVLIKTPTIIFARRRGTCIKSIKRSGSWQRSERLQKERYGTKCPEKIVENLDFVKSSNFIRGISCSCVLWCKFTGKHP